MVNRVKVNAKHLKIYLPQSLYDVLKEYSETKGLSMSDIVKLALYEYLEKRGITVNEK